MRHDDPATLAKYVKENDLLNEPGWKRPKKYVKSAQRMNRNLKQARRFATRTKIKYKIDVKVTRNDNEAQKFDRDNNNTLWEDAIQKELDQVITEYNACCDIGKYKNKSQIPRDHQLIRVNLIFNVKHDLRHKCRLVAGGHKTTQIEDTSNSSAASLRSIRIV